MAARPWLLTGNRQSPWPWLLLLLLLLSREGNIRGICCRSSSLSDSPSAASLSSSSLLSRPNASAPLTMPVAATSSSLEGGGDASPNPASNLRTKNEE
jgi:hypothetical protein